MQPFSSLRLAIFVASVAFLPGLVAAQQTKAPAQAPATKQLDEEEQPTPAPLVVGSMAIASDAALTVDSMAVDVSLDRVAYAYKLKNTGTAKLTLAASVALPDLEVNNEGTTVYLLPTQIADNVVGLTVQSNGARVATVPHVQAVALGVDRLADLKSAGMPLIPFGEATERALAAAKPDVVAKLENLGLVTPHDPAQPNAPVIGDWSLHVVHSWMQDLAPNAVTDVDVEFMPIKALYTIDASSLPAFDALRDQACLTPQFMGQVKALLAAKGSTVDVADILLANDGPARWLQNPRTSVSVHKPTPGSLVAFCGIEGSSQGKPLVTGSMPTSSEAGGLRVLIFARNDGK